ncbi:MAG: hypothetical protein HDR82_09620 [Bacteroides sp.]|nr:hypothetical protein [Bacteroides sp.]
MNTPQQDLAWSILPKGVRDGMRYEYRKTLYHQVRDVLDYFFGRHNFTSDTEPEEMLMVERSEIIQNYTNSLERSKESNNPIETYSEGYYDGQTAILEELFGDKCLPDKEEPKPKFKYNIGDLVTYRGKVKKVICKERDCKDNAIYTCSTINGQSPLVFNEIDLEPYTEQNKDNMITTENGDLPNSKELDIKVINEEPNLCELLKGCKGEEFYSLSHGEVILDNIRTNPCRGISEFLVLYSKHYDSGSIFINPNGKTVNYGSILLYPSRALYEKYPLDAYSAWMEWKEAKKQKRWRAEVGEFYWRIIFDESYDNCITESCDGRDTIDNANYKLGNYFPTKRTRRPSRPISQRRPTQLSPKTS